MEYEIKKAGVSIMKGKKKRCLAMLFAVAFICVTLTGCGDGITDETKKMVTDKTNQALELYADIERTVEEHKLTASREFIDMKEKLTKMSTQIKEQVESTTEEDGKMAVSELDKIIANLQSVKKNVEEGLVKVQQAS